MSTPDPGALTAQIYLAALSHDQWPKVLDAIGGALRGASAILAVHPLCGGLQWAMTSHIDPASLVAYEAKFSTPQTNPYLLLCDRLPVGEPLAAETIAGAEQFEDRLLARHPSPAEPPPQPGPHSCSPPAVWILVD